jgi:hypothetical protein
MILPSVPRMEINRCEYCSTACYSVLKSRKPVSQAYSWDRITSHLSEASTASILQAIVKLHGRASFFKLSFHVKNTFFCSLCIRTQL